MAIDKVGKGMIGGVIMAAVAMVGVVLVTLAALGAIETEAGRVVVDGESLLTVFVLVLVLGSGGGLAYDITEPLHPSKTWNAASFENRTTVPRLARDTLEWGFVGPMFVGAIAAVIVVFLVGIERLPASDATRTPAEFIQLNRLIVLSLVAGFAGSLVLRVMRSRLAAVLKITELTAVAAEAKSALEAQEDPEMSPEEKRVTRKHAVKQLGSVIESDDPRSGT